MKNTSKNQKTGGEITIADSLSHGTPIEVLPEEIIFKDIQINQTYEITVFVRNLTKIARRIRVFQPKTSKFRADYDMQGAIAAGLAMKLIITFETSVLEEFHDSIKIVSDGGFSIEVPLHAYPPQAGIIFEPFINLGFVRVNKEKVEQIFFKNEGKSVGKVELRFDKLPDFKIEPTNFTLQPNQEFAVNVYYKPREAGIFRGLIEVSADGNPLQKTIDINATSIEFTRFLIDENGTQTNQFDFGTTYYGQLKVIETYLVNNTPKQQKFKVKIKQGLHNSAEEMGKLQTPSELGIEQTERIMDCQPEEGTVDSYSQIPIIFRCRSKVSEKHMIWTRQYAMSNEDLRAESDDFHYSAVFEFLQDSNDSLITHLSARCICPTVKFPNNTIMSFGSCASNSHKDILFQLRNTNRELPVDITFPIIPYFSVSPATQSLDPEQQFGFWASFKPKHTGNFSSTLQVEILGGVYKIPLKLNGSSHQFQQKDTQKRGPECLPEDFNSQRNEKKDQSFSILQIKKQHSSLDLSQSIKSLVDQQGINKERIEELRQMSLNREIYNSYLKEKRNDRLKGEKDKIIKQKYAQMNERLKELGITMGNNQGDKPIGGPTSQVNQSQTASDDENSKPTPPIDYEFAVGMAQHGLDEPKLRLPEEKNGLYVTKPIDRYEPLKAEKHLDGKVKKSFNPDPNQIMRKKFPHEPKTHSEIRDTSIELSSEMLQKIDAGPVKIEFGHIYIKSKVTKTFYIRNDLRTSISARLHSDREELAQSYFKKQIIPSGQVAGFDIVLLSQVLGQVKQNIKYIINERHIFEFMVTAQIDPVQLELSRQSIKFAFSEDNVEMETSEPLRITNNGNAPGKFKFQHTDKKIFTANPEEGEVPAGGFLDIKITYKPTQTNTLINQSGVNSQALQQQQPTLTAALTRNEDEKINMKVYDGIDQSLKCSGTVNEPKCSIKQSVIDLKEIAVCKQEVKPLTIKNHSRTPAVFHIMVSKLPENVEITPSKGKILAEEQKDLQVRFSSKEERNIKGEILVLIRGGKILKVPFVVTTIIPKVEIIQDEFNFGNITTLGNSVTLKMTVINNSNIAADLVLDLRTENENPQASDGIECLDVKPTDDADESLLHSVHLEEDEQQNKVKQEKQEEEKYEDVELDGMADDESEGSEPIELETKQNKLYNLTLIPGKSIQFNLKFSPKEVRQYNFLIPLTLARYGPLQSLNRYVICRGLKPKFLIEPQQVEFKKKIISTPDKCFPTTMEITLSNPDRRDVSWKIDATSLKLDKIFEIEPLQGTVPQGQQTRIRVKFNPFGPGQFEGNVPLFILSDPEISPTLPYVDIYLSGQGAYPRLLFDKKEVILPVVPLTTIARCSFRILNDGYENLNLVHKWGQEVGNFHVELKFPEGKNLGITRSRLKVDVLFSHKKPLSFTTRLEFIDEARVYSINISGTTDNSLFTNFVYLQRQLGEFKIVAEDKKPITFIDEDDDAESVVSDAKSRGRRSKKNFTHSVKSSKSTSSKATSALGYTPLKQDQLDDSCDAICRWLNYHVLTQAISTFPDSVIEHNGNEIFELMTFLTGKAQFSFKANLDQQSKRVERADLLFKQYDELIRILKVEGALLNHIRPEYLLSYPDYLAWIKAQPREKFEYVPENLLRLTIQRFQYASTDAWIVLFYQILKIYYLGRITPKILKSVPGVPFEKQNVPDYYVEGSNLISSAEGTLLWWYETCYEMAHPLQVRRLGNFSTAFQDCLAIAASIQSYVGQSAAKLFQNLRGSCQTEDDFKSNADKVLFALTEVGLQSHISTQDLFKPHQREMLLFLIQLFFALPHYIPKSQPIMFLCVLGEEVIKSIDLTNPTSKAISYWAKYEGHPDFVLEGEESFKIEPKQTYKYKIKFTSRISQSVNGRVIFTNKKETNVQAAALVFELRSQITGRRSERQWTVSSALYEQFDFPITITNKFQFSEQGEFQIQVVHERVFREETKIRKKVNKKKIPETAESQSSEVFPAFFCRLEKVRIKRGQQVSITLTFLPLTMDQHKCYVIFTDPNVGEFQHEVLGSVELPSMTGDIKPDRVLYVDTATVMNFEVPYKNELMMRARRTIEQMISDKNRDRYQRGDKSSNPNVKINFPGGVPEQLILECEVQPATQYLSVPGSVTLVDPYRYTRKQVQQQQQETSIVSGQGNISKDKKQQQQQTITKQTQVNKQQNQDQSFDSKLIPGTQGGQMMEADPNANKLPISYAFKNPVKDFNILLTMRNSNKTDIRRYKIWATVLPKIVKSILEFRVPARQSVTQEIPIVNNTEREWTIRVNLQTDGYKNGYLFSCPQAQIKEFQVKKKSIGIFPLTFSPIWVQTSEAKLTLSNPLTNDVFEYEIKGFGEEPVAEEHIILNCQARKISKRDIEITNPYQDKQIVYKVETDLINATGPPSLTILPGKKAIYVLQVCPVLSGQYTGSITFTDDDGKYLWYTVFLNTESPKSIQTLEISTLIRQASVFTVVLANPLDIQANYEVIINGDGLVGESIFTVPPKDKGKYDLMFAPLKVGKWKGSVAFISQQLGEVWYDLQLSSDEQAPVRLNVMKASLGKIEQQTVTLENPSDSRVQIISKVTNPTNFDVHPEEIFIAPYESAQVNLRYTPSSLDVIESSDIIFQSQTIGKWHFLVFGQGLPPTKFPTTTVSIGLNKDYSSVVHFKNPFKEPIQVTVTLEAEGHNNDVFKLLLLNRKKGNGEIDKTLVPGMNVMQVPFSFVPREITCYYAEIVISMNEKIQWRFPLKGITESVNNQTLFHFKTKCREKWEDEVKVGLTGIVQSLGPDDRFDFELANIPSELQSLVRNCFQVRNLKNHIEYPHDNLLYFVKFQPMKPFKTSLDFIVLRQSGGRWKFKIQLEATEPEDDDNIIISSPLNKTTSVSFKLTNKVKSYARFVAAFSPESDAEFSVMPKQGDLEPYGREGTTFIISFTPVEYGKIRKGKLVIQTDDMYWSYNIKGVLPRYDPPTAKESLIDNRIDQRMMEQISTTLPKNFLVENIRKSKNSPPPQRQSKEQAKTNKSLFPTLNDSTFRK